MLSLQEIQDLVEKAVQRELADLAARTPANLYSPVQHILGLKGKRLRPAMVIAACNLFSDDVHKAVSAALAVEVFHNFTLLHDDIMDKADMRRNEPTVHRKFGENAAILSGDVMSFLSFRYLLQTNTSRLKELLDLFAVTAVEVCEGQQLDMDFESRNEVTPEEYIEMIRLKTAVLLGCSLKAGAIIADAAPSECNELYNFGIHLGLAFQLQDDLLDTYGDQKTFGKKIGGDIIANKKTYLLIKALELATPILKEELTSWIGRKNYEKEEKIDAVVSIYNQVGIRNITVEKIAGHIANAESIMQKISVYSQKKQTLFSLVETVRNRNY